MKSNLRSEKRKVHKGLWILREIDRSVIRPNELAFHLARPLPNPRQVQNAHLFLSPRKSVIVVTNFIMDGETSVRTDWTAITCKHVERDVLVIRNYYKPVDITEIMVEIALGVLSPTVHGLWTVLGESKGEIFCWEKRQEFQSVLDFF